MNSDDDYYGMLPDNQQANAARHMRDVAKAMHEATERQAPAEVLLRLHAGLKVAIEEFTKANQ